ncbi:MAG: MerR family DNA-binding transcriptional regulator, partial [Bifidobacteriaceae bacterium]|nr:MerR family DNA-binding transcriptional regulator [Bifidobacteriaceae bacterium]
MEFTSKQIADLAGVTVRTLRHYHQIGMLPEPERTWGGYRLYLPEDVLSLLRIKRLARLGLRLDQVAAILANPAGTETTRMLKTRDQELKKEIAVKREQRHAIADILRSGGRPDVLPEFAERLTKLRELGVAGDDSETLKLAADLVASLGDPEDSRRLQAILDQLIST